MFYPTYLAKEAKMRQKLETLKAEVLASKCPEIEARREEILSLIPRLQEHLGNACGAIKVARELTEVLERLSNKAPEIPQLTPSQRTTDNGGQDANLLEEALLGLQVLTTNLQRLLYWNPERLCSECGRPIEAERMTLVPNTNLCSECARKSTKGRNRR